MSLPVLHPEKVLGTRGPRGVWSSLVMYSMQKLFQKKITITWQPNIIYNCCTPDFDKIAAALMNGFTRTQFVFVASESWMKAITKKNNELVESALEYLKTNKFFVACRISGNVTSYFMLTEPVNKRANFAIAILNFIENGPDNTCSFVSADMVYIDGCLGTLHPPQNSDVKSHLLLVKMTFQALAILGYKNNPYIIPHHSRSGEKNTEKGPTSQQEIERYSIPITYVTTATYKDRTYRALNAQVSGHIRKQRCGPGRLHVKEVFIEGHERKYKNGTT